MANFNDHVNRGIGYIMNSQEFFIYRTGTINEFARMIHDELYLLTNTYRLFIQYKTNHRAKKLAGRCFLWDNSHGDHMADPGNGIELRSLNDASQDDCEGFSKPRFNGMESAILIADSYVFAYGDVKIEADSITKDKKHVICTVSLCGFIVSFFRIPAEVFDRFFGLKENFPKQYDEIFGQAKVPYAEPFDAKVEADDQAETESAAIVEETAPESTNDDETTKHTANVENASEWTIDETDMTDTQWLCKWLSERRPEYKAVCEWMYEREEERKTDDSLDAKETRDAVMIVGGRGGEMARVAKTRQERNRDA